MDEITAPAVSSGAGSGVDSGVRSGARHMAERTSISMIWSWTWISILCYIGLGYLGPVWELVFDQPVTVRSVVLGVFLVLSAALSVTFIRHAIPGLGRRIVSPRESAAIIVVTTIPWIVSSINIPWSMTWGLLPWIAASLVAVDLPQPRRWWWLGASAVTLLLVRILVGVLTGASWDDIFSLGDDPISPLLIPLLLIMPALLIFQVWLWDVVVRLKASQEVVAELARTRERLRFASDLHDVQGHHLQVIALKTELAERLIDQNPAAAKPHIIEAQSQARQALQETRALVRGYRRIGLATEAANAKAVLEAAGVRCAIQIDNGAETDLDVDQLLGSLLREATTNILRHSNARTVDIRVRQSGHGLELSMTNDGALPGPTSSDGTGLSSLAERFAQAGGSLSHAHEGGRFALSGSLPTVGEQCARNKEMHR